MLIEDEAIIAIHLEQILLDLGCEIVGSATNIDDAKKIATSLNVDLAILDVNLNGQPIYPVADILKRRGIPFIFATGYSSSGLDAAYADAPRLPKPIEEPELKKLIAKMRLRA